MIVIPILIIVIILVLRMQKGMFAAFLFFIATKSVIDAFWDLKFGPVSILALQGVLIPIIFKRVFSTINTSPRSWFINSKIYFIALSLGLIWILPLKPIAAIEAIVLNLNVFLGFFLIPFLVKERSQLKSLLIAMMISGVFPILVSFYQFQTGVIFRVRATVGLTRYVGFYHDAFPVRFYGLMTIIAILIYVNTFKLKLLDSVKVITLGFGALFSIYLVYSKAGIGIILLWALLFILFSKLKRKQFMLIVFMGVIMMLVFSGVIYENIEQLFSKEIGYQSGSVKDARYTLAGRGYIWQDYWNFWVYEQTMFFKWMGDGVIRPAHNEFLRVLLANGILGLIFLIVFVFRSAIEVLRINKKIKVFGLMLFGMYMVDCIGLVPGVYYYYNILLWGLLSLFLFKPHLFYKEEKKCNNLHKN